MDLKGDLIKNKPREISGSSSSNRFQFQKNWALCKLLEMQLNNEEYIVILDFHDDILIIDSDTAPSIAKFYQIKSKSKNNWSLTNLTTKKNGGNSIMGKLYYNKLTFPNHDIELNFVSNAHYKLKLKNETSDDASLHYKDICFNCLEDKQITKTTQKLVEEFSLGKNPDFKDITYLRVTELGIESHVTYTKGKLAEYFDALDPRNRVNSATAYRMLSTEIAKRNDYEWKIQSFDEMIKLKGITKTEFQKLLNDLIQHSQVYEEWNPIENNLMNSGMMLGEIKKLKNNWRQYDIERLNRNNHILQDIRDRVIKIINDKDDYINYNDLIKTVINKYKSSYSIDKILYDENYIKAIILMEYSLC